MATPDNVPAASYSLVINGVDITSYLESASWTINQQFSRQGDTATFNLFDENVSNFAGISLHFVITPLSSIVLTDLSLGEVLFSGLVTYPTISQSGPNLQKWELQCVDWTYMSDRCIVFGDFSTQSADQIIKSLISQANIGLTYNNVSPGPVIPRLQIVYLTLSEAIQKVCDFAGAVQTYGWYIDENRDVHFYNENNAGTVQAVFSDALSDFLPGNYVPGYTGNYKSDYSYGWDATSIRNSVYVRGATYETQFTDQWLGNGTQVTWPLTYTPDTQDVATTVDLTIAGVPKTISVQSGTSADTQWALVQNANGGWSLTNVSDTVPAASALIDLTYNFVMPVTALIRDSSSIASMSTLPNGGVFSTYIADSTLQSIAAASMRGQRETQTYALPEERVNFNSSEVYTGHVRAGQIITFKCQYVPDSTRSNALGINDTFLILQNSISGGLVGYRKYGITAARVSTGGGP